MKPKFIGQFDSPQSVFDTFDVKDPPKGAKILIAAYSYEDYSGCAIVVYEQGQKLYEVHGSHCSCHGLEGQWEPEETTKAALLKQEFSYEPWGEEVKAAIRGLP